LYSRRQIGCRNDLFGILINLLIRGHKIENSFEIMLTVRIFCNIKLAAERGTLEIISWSVLKASGFGNMHTFADYGC